MDAWVGEIRLFAGTRAPQNFAFCDGSLIKVSDNQILFSVIGYTYGGDGVTTFALPDLRGRAAVHQGAGPSLTPRALGQRGGTETVVLSEQSLPAHTHAFYASTAAASSTTPSGSVVPAAAADVPAGRRVAYYPSSDPGQGNFQLDTLVLAPTGGGGAHDNMMPSLAINYIICISGNYPPRQ